MNAERLHLLIVEDEAAHVEAIRRAFEKADANVEIRAVGTLREFRTAVADHLPDVALVDLNLPDGKATEALTYPPEDAPFPILVMTAYGNQEIVVKVMKAGALDYVVKSPEAFAALPHTVESLLREWKLLQKHKRGEVALRENEEKFRALFEGSRDAIMTLAPPFWRFTSGNPATVKLFGAKNEEEFTSYGLGDLSPERQPAGRASAETSKEMIETAIREGSCFFEWTHRRIGGEEFFANVLLTRVKQGGKVLLQATVRDISERKRVEATLRESEGRYRTLFEDAQDSMALADTETGRLVDCNRALCRMVEREKTELLGQAQTILHPAQDLIDGQSPIFREHRQDASGQAPEDSLLTKSGALVPVEIRVAHIRMNERDYLLGVFRDITERKRAEEEHEKLQAQFAQAQKMESVGRLAGGVAHDFNNMLMGIMGYAELCRDKIAPDHPIREWLNEITLEAERSAQLSHQLLAFARKQIIAPKVLDVNAAVLGMLKLLRRLVGEDVVINWRPETDTWPVKMDPGQIDQILANLAVNARDAIGGVGSINIATSNVTFDQSCCSEHLNSLPGNYILLTVTDSGCGMPKEVLDHIFEPFFTTKGVGEGTGLGLATVFGIVKQNNGFINVYSEPGKGTAFKIYLPRFVTPEAAPVAVEMLTKPPRGNETVLLVEDEKSVRMTTQILLEDLGYTMLVAKAPEQALRLVAEHPGEIHLLITDVIMPGMSGRDLANRLAELRPAIECLFISGFTADVIAQRGILDSGVNFLSKPFGRDLLARKVREVLDGS